MGSKALTKAIQEVNRARRRVEFSLDYVFTGRLDKPFRKPRQSIKKKTKRLPVAASRPPKSRKFTQKELDIKRARALWRKASLSLEWVCWTHKNAAVILRHYEANGNLYDCTRAMFDKQAPTRKKVRASTFTQSPEWKIARAEAIRRHGGVCMKCGSTKHINVDHIKPKSLYPEIALDQDNLQILCWPCNKGKSNKGIEDYRKPQIRLAF